MIVPSGCVISGVDVPVWARAMAEAGAPFELTTDPDRLRLPTRQAPEQALLDPSGGVVDVDAVRAHLTGLTREALRLEPVEAIDHEAHVSTRSGGSRFDAVLVAAGAGTAALAAQVGIAVPGELEHHARFTFPVDPGTGWRSWIDLPAAGPGGSRITPAVASGGQVVSSQGGRSGRYRGCIGPTVQRGEGAAWASRSRPELFGALLSTYQHASGPGRWAVGGHLDPATTAWEVGRDAATGTAREAVLEYARERLAVEPRIVETVHCTPTPGLGDGFHVQRAGRVVTVHGENLFKFAPVLGTTLAAACL
ncbi:hypothetical protein BJF90_03935 [Pseudonocardia sp. CNS-004]|nr:hypothetical protein BJF90_03935 [Pseudonocardia sp. CNS-004]